MFESGVFVVETNDSKFLGSRLMMEAGPGDPPPVGFFSAQNARFMYLVPKAAPKEDPDAGTVKFTSEDRGRVTIRGLLYSDREWIVANGWTFEGTEDQFVRWCEWQAGLRDRTPFVQASVEERT
jgi:hypothetical protein